eukprot:TRINITY_DN2_c4_g1_i3.p1 TRINITY_DN2_c4_g1~~TRINITY_DN2_c4_g1_i3.p1  ORF type:complete len:707 (-),score=337.62 TRINITY_DN2_c4_g1_i3:161-2281(-)
MAEELAKKFGNDLSVSIYQVIIDQNNGDVGKAAEQIQGFNNVEEDKGNNEDDFEEQLKRAEEMSKREAALEQERLLEKFKREKEKLDEINRKKRERERKEKEKKEELEKEKKENEEEDEFERQLRLAAELSLKEEEKKFEEQQRRALEKFKKDKKEREERKKLKEKNPEIKEEIPESSLYQENLEKKRIEKEQQQKSEKEKPKKKKKSIIIEEVDTLDDIKEVEVEEEEEEIKVVQEPLMFEKEKFSFKNQNLFNDNNTYNKLEDREEEEDIYSFSKNYGGFNLSNQYGNIFPDDQENPLNGENTFEVEIDMDQEKKEKKEKQNIYKNKTQCFSITHSIPNLSDDEIKKITNEIIHLNKPLAPKVCIYIRPAHKQGTQEDIDIITQFFKDNYQISEKEIMNIDVSNDVELGYFLKTICKEVVSYPLVCINGKVVGNLETLKKYHQENKIKQLLDNPETSVVYEQKSSDNNVNNNNDDNNSNNDNNSNSSINEDNKVEDVEENKEESNVEEDKKSKADELVDDFIELGEEEIVPSGQYHGQNILDHCLDATEYVVSSVSSLLWLPVTIVTYPFRSANDLDKKETDIEFDIVHTNFYWRNLKRKFRFSDKLFYRIHPGTLETRATHAYTTIKSIVMTNNENIIIQYNDKSQSDYICALPEDIKSIISLILIRCKQANHNVLVIRPQIPDKQEQEDEQEQEQKQEQEQE